MWKHDSGNRAENEKKKNCYLFIYIFVIAFVDCQIDQQSV